MCEGNIMSKKEIIIDKKHYKINGEDLITAMENGLVSKEQYIGFLKGNIMKYLVRCEYKNNTLSDLTKAKDYLNRLYDFFKEDEIKVPIIKENDFIKWDSDSCDCSQCEEECSFGYHECGCCDEECGDCGSDYFKESVDEIIRRYKIHRIAQILSKYGEDNE